MGSAKAEPEPAAFGRGGFGFGRGGFGGFGGRRGGFGGFGGFGRGRFG